MLFASYQLSVIQRGTDGPVCTGVLVVRGFDWGGRD